MKNIALSLLALSIFISGCSFGEYADTTSNNHTTQQTKMLDGTKYYKFTQKNIEKKTLFRVYKLKKEWNMTKYDFNSTHFTANQIKGKSSRQTGVYKITDDGHLQLAIPKTTTYIKATNEDDDKIFLLWTTKKADLNQTKPTKDTYFFKTKKSADSFIKK